MSHRDSDSYSGTGRKHPLLNEATLQGTRTSMGGMRPTSRRSAALLGALLAIVSVAGGGAGSKVVSLREMDDGATTIDELRERPIELPELEHDDRCPLQPITLVEGADIRGIQAGPVAAVIVPEFAAYFIVPSTGDQERAVGKILWLVQADQPALLARGRQLDGNGTIRFGDENAKELVLDLDTTSTVGPSWRDQPSGPSITRSGCYGVQIDGPDFQAVIVFSAHALGASAERSTRSIGVRDLRLDRDESLEVSLHPSDVPIEIDTAERDVEVCANGWPSFAGFVDCIPVDADGHATLPSTDSTSFHLGFSVQGVDGDPVDISRLTITYELIDGYFVLHPPPIEPGATSAQFVVTPVRRSSIDIALTERGTNDPAPSIRAEIRQHGERVRRGGLGSGHGDTYGPVELDRPLSVVVKNRGSTPSLLDLLVDWY